MIEITYNWTDAGSPEDHAKKTEAIGHGLILREHYADANDLYIAAQCIRGLNEENEALRETLKELRNSPEVSRGLWLAVEGEKALAAHNKEVG